MPRLKGSGVSSDAYADPTDALNDVMRVWNESPGLESMTPAMMHLVIPGVGSVSFRNYSEQGFEREIEGKIDSLRYSWEREQAEREFIEREGGPPSEEELEAEIEAMRDALDREWDDNDYIVEIRGHTGRYKQTEG